MRIRNPLAIKWIGLVGAWLLRIYAATLCLRLRMVGPNLDPRRPGLQGHYIFAIWHEMMFVPAAVFGRRNVVCLISEHADGEMIARICLHSGFGVVRGSTTRGGARALRQMIRLSRKNHFVVLPDGPRGPRRRLEQGLIYLAARTGLPLVLAGIGYDRPWRLRTWDRFAVPRPWSKAVVLFGEPLHVPPGLSRQDMEAIRGRAEAAMNALANRAEKLAEG